MRRLGHEIDVIPQPVNFFTNTRIETNGQLVSAQSRGARRLCGVGSAHGSDLRRLLLPLRSRHAGLGDQRGERYLRARRSRSAPPFAALAAGPQPSIRINRISRTAEPRSCAATPKAELSGRGSFRGVARSTQVETGPTLDKTLPEVMRPKRRSQLAGGIQRRADGEPFQKRGAGRRRTERSRPRARRSPPGCRRPAPGPDASH